LDGYLDALSSFPNIKKPLLTEAGKAYHQKTDVFKGILWYTLEDAPNDFVPLEKDEVNRILKLNNEGKKIASLKALAVKEEVEAVPDYENVVGQDSLTRFDKKRGGSGKGNRRRKNRNRSQKRNKRGGKKES
jgi:hypothetical protein